MNIGGAAARNVYGAVSRGDVAGFQRLVREDPFLINEASFTGSRNLLHIATLCGQARIVEAVLNISPRLARCLDSQNWSPLHIAAAEGHLEIARKLLTVAPEMCWSRDCQGMNPVHIAAVRGRVEMLERFFELDHSLPAKAAMERVHRGQTVLHLCVKHCQFPAFEYLVGKMAREFVSAKDDDGDTVLHWAVRTNQVQMVRCLVGKKKIRRTAKNSMGKTALNILTKDIASDDYSAIRKLLLSGFLSPFATIFLSDTASAMIMVVTALIATMAFQAISNPPGGVWKDESPTHHAGKAVMSSTHPTLYYIYLGVNSITFVLSFLTILLICIGHLYEKLNLMRGIAMHTMWFSILCIAGIYAYSLKAITPNKINRQLLIVAMGTLLFSVIFLIIFVFLLLIRGVELKIPAFMRRLWQQKDDRVQDPQPPALPSQINSPSAVNSIV